MGDVPTELVTFLADLPAAERVTRGTRADTRAPHCTDQAVFALVWFRENHDIPMIGKGLGISQATSHRYLDEAVDVLTARAPTCTTPCSAATTRTGPTSWATARSSTPTGCASRRPVPRARLSMPGTRGVTHDVGGNVQALFRPDGFPVWISPVEPGSVHDLTAARDHVLGALYAAAGKGLPTLADPGYDGAGHGIHTPVKQPADGTELDITTRTRTTGLRSVRCRGERGFALLTPALAHPPACHCQPSKITKIAQAALVLTHFEPGYLPC